MGKWLDRAQNLMAEGGETDQPTLRANEQTSKPPIESPFAVELAEIKTEQPSKPAIFVPVRPGQRWAIRPEGDPWKLRRRGEVLEVTAVLGDSLGYVFEGVGARGVMRIVDLKARCVP